MRIITGSARGKKLTTLEGEQVRPTSDRVKEALFNIIQFDLEGRNVLDLFAGSGQIGLEAISRGASHAVLVDASKESIQVIRDNVRHCGFGDFVEIVSMDFSSYLMRKGQKFDLAFLDPPYGQGLLQKALPLVAEVMNLGGTILCEHPVGGRTSPGGWQVCHGEMLSLWKNCFDHVSAQGCDGVMKIGIYPGSFDPITLGHLDVISRAVKVFDKLIVAVMVNPNKHFSFTEEERVELIRKAAQGIENIEIVSFDGLLADYAKMRNATAIVKGLRALSDFEYEFQMALTNKKLNPMLDTLFLATSAEYMFLSSSMVKQVASFGGDISAFVPSCILEEIQERLSRDNRERSDKE